MKQNIMVMQATRYVFICFFLYLFPTVANSITMSECNTIASEINKDFPLRSNSYTTVVNSVCVGTNQIYLAYVQRVDYAKSQFQINKFKELRQSQINQWCSTPSQRHLLSFVGIKYIYYDNTNIYIGETSFTIKNCN